MSKEQYTAMWQKILTNKDWYEKIPDSLPAGFQKEYYIIVNEALGLSIISKYTCEYLHIEWPRTTRFYALPKVHKSLKSPLGRPVISECGSFTENASRVVDVHLK